MTSWRVERSVCRVCLCYSLGGAEGRSVRPSQLFNLNLTMVGSAAVGGTPGRGIVRTLESIVTRGTTKLFQDILTFILFWILEF
jgi:hypothetical protein